MGTQYRITLGVDAASDSELETLQATIEDRLDAFNSVFSTYDPNSLISRWNDSDAEAATGPNSSVAPALYAVVRTAITVAEESDGAFDPTVAPLVNRWQFGPNRQHLEPPSDLELDQLREQVGWTLVDCVDVAQDGDPADGSPALPRLLKRRPDVRLDLSAIAKGTGVDVLCETLKAAGYNSFLVDIGGELRSVGTKPGGHPWKVAVRDPAAPFDATRQSQPAELTDAAIATSGSYFNYHEVDGKRYSHTIDPRTGRPITHDVVSVTVVACRCELADAYATTLMVLGPDAGYDWAAERGIAALLIRESGPARSTPQYNAWLSSGSIECPE